MPTLFDTMVERAALPRTIARAALVRALRRVGLTPDALDESSLRSALSSVESTLRVYHDHAEAARRARAIRALCAA